MPITILFFTALVGRFFCGWFCAFGTFNDIIYTLSKRIFKLKFRVSRKVDNVLKYLKYFVSAFIVYFIWTMGNTSLSSYNPWDAFAQIPHIFDGSSVDYLPGFVVLSLITLGSMFIERFFCRYLCPLGAVFSIVSLTRLTSINKPRTNCGNCTLCSYNCSMGIDLSKSDRIKSKECIWCMKCIENCPKNNANSSIVAFDVRAGYFVLIATILFLELYRADKNISSYAAPTPDAVIDQKYNPADYNINNNAASDGTPDSSQAHDNSTSDTLAAGSGTANSSISSQNQKIGVSSSASQPKSSTSSASSSPAKSTSSSSISTTKPINATTQSSTPVKTNKLYNDGTYTGYGRGHGGTIQVAVTVKIDKITDIQILSHHETYGYFEEPFSIIPEEIISSQSTDVDGISGATRSSNGLINAVSYALEQARIS